MPSTTTLASNPPPRRTSPIVETIQRSPVLSPRTAEPRQQRSGSVHPSSPPHRSPTPPQRISTPPQPPPEQKTENGSHDPQVIEMETFEQILEMDDDPETREFSHSLVWDYFTQAEDTFKTMEKAIDEKDCKKLSGLGHFLKGSSATLGVVGVRDSCESIQHYGNLRDEKTGKDLTSEVALSKISVALREAEKAYKEAKKWLREYYEALGVGE